MRFMLWQLIAVFGLGTIVAFVRYLLISWLAKRYRRLVRQPRPLQKTVCQLRGHTEPVRYWLNAAGDAGGWLCGRCRIELPAPKERDAQQRSS